MRSSTPPFSNACRMKLPLRAKPDTSASLSAACREAVARADGRRIARCRRRHRPGAWNRKSGAKGSRANAARIGARLVGARQGAWPIPFRRGSARSSRGTPGGRHPARLQRTRSAYMIVDRPPDLYADVAAGSGRLVRRYRDCLLQFAQDDDETSGEVHCPPSSGYAIGSDIGLPVSVGPREPPPEASPAIASYWGRWEGDDDLGAYVIMDAIGAREKVILFRTGYSNTPWVPEPRTSVRDITFELNEGDGYLRDTESASVRHADSAVAQIRDRA